MLDLSKVASNHLPGKLLRFPLRCIPKRTVLPILQGPLFGKKWITGSGVASYWLGSYEKGKQVAFAGALRPNDVVWDIGANVGFYTLLAAMHCRTVYAFEPFPDNVRDISRHMALNHVTNVTVFEVALAGTDATRRMGTYNRSQCCLEDDGPLQVCVRTVDSLVRDGLEPPTLIKMDIEATEVECLLGALETIERARPRIFLATHWGKTKGPCVAILTALGYEFSQIDGDPEETLCTPTSA